MSGRRKLTLGYFVVLLAVAGLNYVPGVRDEAGLVFGVFALDPYDDALHLASALWALGAGLISERAARSYLVLFGLAYLADGVFGLFTGWGFLDLGIFTNASLGFDLALPRLLANLPHLALGGLAAYAGLRKV
ncbi:hypothetical protein [Thalassobius sp. MITS945101]|uniref:hypothetical protein n=1 Tax=Thalassobius sp. MITS945101 TaxID=3096994 RepID=UPI003999DF9D